MCDCLICFFLLGMGGGDIIKFQGQSPGTLLYFHPTSSMHESFLPVCLGHFSNKSAHCVKGQPTTKTRRWHKSLRIVKTYRNTYLVLQGFPTTKTFAFREATALSAFPWHNSKISDQNKNTVTLLFFLHTVNKFILVFVVYAHCTQIYT